MSLYVRAHSAMITSTVGTLAALSVATESSILGSHPGLMALAVVEAISLSGHLEWMTDTCTRTLSKSTALHQPMFVEM